MKLPVGIIAVMLGVHILPLQAPVAPKATIDISGLLMFFIVLGSRIIGPISLPGNNQNLWIAALIVPAIFWIILIVLERRGKEPLITISLFAGRAHSPPERERVSDSDGYGRGHGHYAVLPGTGQEDPRRKCRHDSARVAVRVVPHCTHCGKDLG
ncbi:MAG: hypothetical protein WCF90_07010 [Methanomicrobiales archaeon]